MSRSDDKASTAGEAVGKAVDAAASVVTGGVDLAKGAIADPAGTARGLLGKAGRFLSGLAEKPKDK
jgi:hypothetical protein